MHLAFLALFQNEPCNFEYFSDRWGIPIRPIPRCKELDYMTRESWRSIVIEHHRNRIQFISLGRISTTIILRMVSPQLYEMELHHVPVPMGILSQIA